MVLNRQGWVAVFAVIALAGCRESVEERFKAKVVPVLEARCASSSCHGVPQTGAPPGIDTAKWLTFPIDSAGRITDLPGALASVKAKINSAENSEYSTFLRKTLPVTAGGLHHFQSALFQDRTEAGYRALSEFAAMVKDGAEGTSPALDEREQHFATTIYPELIARGCATGSCHGSLMFGGASFEAPVLPGTTGSPRTSLRATYGEAKRNLTLWGNPLRSRLLTKILPIDRGGVPHKGGNDVFFASELENGVNPVDSTFGKAILQWIELERAAALGAAATAPPADPPIVFVGGPLSPAGPFQVPPFTPGTDLYRLDPPYTGAPVNLTASAHASPADIRDPAVNHDGTRIVFSMRTTASDAHNLYVIGVDGTGLRQLTTDSAVGGDGLVIGNFSPVFGPNGGLTPTDGPAPSERIYFSSTRAGERSDVASVQNADLWAIDLDGKHLERLTHTVVPEVMPSFLSTGEFGGTVVYTIKRAAEIGFKGVLFRFPVDHNRDFHIQPEAHPHFGSSVVARVIYGAKELPDGRASVSLLDPANVWRGGQLALLERQFAVEIPDGAETSATLPGFRHALTVLTPNATRQGTSADGLWRDAMPMPDGTLLAAYAPGPIDLADELAAPRTHLVRLVLDVDPATQRPRLKETRPLFDDGLRAASQPVPVIVRPTEDPPHARAWNTTDSTGTLVHNGVQVIEALLAQLPPVSARTLREDVAFVRAVAPLAVAVPLDPTPVPAAETRHGQTSATRLSLTGRMPLFIAAEVPPAEDGSLAAHVPARVSVRVVTLNAEGIATGALQPHWYAVQPGERFPVGIPLTSYNARCGGCHGGMDGKQQSVLVPPTDFVTQASITAALYQDVDRRRPKDLPTVDSTFFHFVDFVKDVQPILTAKCAGCHVAPTPAGGLTLTATPTQHYTDAYESLLEPGTGSLNGYRYVDATGARARGSTLAERLLNRELEAPQAQTGQCPPVGSPQLTAEERTIIFRWIELGATFVGAPP